MQMVDTVAEQLSSADPYVRRRMTKFERIRRIDSMLLDAVDPCLSCHCGHDSRIHPYPGLPDHFRLKACVEGGEGSEARLG